MPEYVLTTQFITTFLVFAGAVAVAATMAVVERRPKDALNPRLLPTTPVMLLAGFVAILATVHMLNLAGVHTGR